MFDNVDCKQGGKYFTFLSTSSSHGNCRLGLIIAKKHIPLAVNRNKIKRAIRESFRCLLSQTQVTLQENTVQSSALNENSSLDNTFRETLNDGVLITAFDVIVLAKSTVATLDNAQLNKELKRQWLRLIEKRQNL